MTTLLGSNFTQIPPGVKQGEAINSMVPMSKQACNLNNPMVVCIPRMDKDFTLRASFQAKIRNPFLETYQNTAEC